jgi:hypothetical protein
MIHISRTRSNFEREPMASPFGFKGGYLSELWQSIVIIESASGHVGLGLGTQSTLWSDAQVFLGNDEAAGNSLMYLMTAYAMRKAQEMPFLNPIELLERLLPATYKYGQRITGRRDLRLTFALNALVALDNAAWQLYCRENDIYSFDEMVPEELRAALFYRHTELAGIPLMSYGVPMKDISGAMDDGYFFLKIKIGSDPEKDGDQEKMLQWDKERLTAIHNVARDRETPYTEDGRIPYYLDANGRYQEKDTLLRLLKAIQIFKGSGFRRCSVYLLHICGQLLDVFIGDIPDRIPYLVHDAFLNLRPRERCLYSFTEPCKIIHAGDKNILYSPVLHLVQHSKPESGRFIFPNLLLLTENDREMLREQVRECCSG